MVRPKKYRHICCDLKAQYFKPKGIPMSELEEVQLSQDEIEALRLKYIQNLDQTEGALRMQISQSTFARILQSVNQKIAMALVEGKAIRLSDRQEFEGEVPQTSCKKFKKMSFF